MTTQSAAAMEELIATITHVAAAYPEDDVFTGDDDVAEALRLVMIQLGTGIELQFEQDPQFPTFREIVQPWRKSMGDNVDARYHDAAIAQSGVYRVTGSTAGAVYVSFTVECGPDDGSFSTATSGVLNDADFDVVDGRFEITLGGPRQNRNWLALPADASRVTVRHYWEDGPETKRSRAVGLELEIDLVSGDVEPQPRAPTDTSIAAGIRRVATFLRTRTLEIGSDEPPAFVSRVPNEFPPPVVPGDQALAAIDAAYSMAPYLLGDDEALVIDMEWPDCRCGNINLWNRHMQTFDYRRHNVSFNRAQTVANADGITQVVVAHTDPGVPNWLDTEGRGFGLVFWRFMLPEGEIVTPRARVVPVASLAGA